MLNLRAFRKALKSPLVLKKQFSIQKQKNLYFLTQAEIKVLTLLLINMKYHQSQERMRPLINLYFG